MTRVLVAGATGYLGGFLIRALHAHGHWVRALSRSRTKLSGIEFAMDEVFLGEVTKPESLKGVADGMDVVISTIGITHQKDGLAYRDVDYQGNANLLQEALAGSVKKFIYVSVLNAREMKELQIVKAKEEFVKDLQECGMDHVVIRPNGYFSDMRQFLEMAKRGRVYLFGDGEWRINPIHGKDVADVCVGAIQSAAREISFGGPRVYTHREIAEEAFLALGTEPRISRIPISIARIVLGFSRLVTPLKFYGPIEFALTVLTRDMIGECRGNEPLPDFFRQEAMRTDT